MNETELCYTPAMELGRLFRAHELSPVAVVDAVLERMQRLNPKLGAFITITERLAREQARAAEARLLRNQAVGPLDGIPYSVKDLDPTAGIRTTFGSMWFRDHLPDEDGAVAARLKATGGVLLGKTNTPQFGHKDMTDNLLGPPCRNPWDLARTPGGSSGGAAAAVAAGLGPVAQGSDGGGSIRGPAAMCGVFGIKPSFGRVSNYPSSDYWDARPASGPITRTVRDAALMLSALAGYDPRDPFSIATPPDNFAAASDGDLSGVRVVWSADLGYAAVDPEVRKVTEAAARRFADLGCHYEERDPWWPDPQPFYTAISSVAVLSRNAERAAEHPEWLEPSLWRAIERGKRYSTAEYGQALQARTTFYTAVYDFFETCDLLLTPQYPVAAWPLDQEPGPAVIGERRNATMYDRLCFTMPFNLTGQPAASVPAGSTSDGLPVGLQIVGSWRDEATVLRAAACFEAVQPWAHRRPPID